MNKEIIKEALNAKINDLGISRNAAAKQIHVSAATISNILNDKWDNITDAWSKVEAWVRDRISGWFAASISNFETIQALCRYAQDNQTSRAVSYRPASGKTFAAKYYADNNPNTHYVCAVGDMGKRQLLNALCSALGIPSVYSLGDMLSAIIARLKILNHPLIIIDEFDELKDTAMRIFKDIYNSVDCGFVLIGGEHLASRMAKGVRKNKQSYQEIYSRIGREFIDLEPIDSNTITQVCKANGVRDRKQIREIVKAAQGDLRRVKGLIKTFSK